MSDSLHDFAPELAVRFAPLSGRLGVAVSGGADSVFLAHILREAGLAACLVHVNHQLRGAESDADEAFVRDLAASLDLPFYSRRLPPDPGNLEQEARRARYAWFETLIADGLCAAVATGHTQDDQAETVLSRFLRGAGTAGLSGILPETAQGLVRPILGVPRAEIRQWLRDRNVTWREDSSNLDTTFLRNRLRHEILPALSGINPAIVGTLASTARWARAEEDFWSGEIERLAADRLVVQDGAVLVQTGRILDLHPAVQRRLLRRMVEIVRGSLRSIDLPHIDAIRQLCESRDGSGRLQLPGLDVFRSFDWLRLAPLGHDSKLDRDFETNLLTPGRTALPDRLLTIETELVTANRVYNREEYAVDFGRCGSDLRLRNWRPGDSLYTGGSPEKIKTLFQEHRIPLWERRAWPVIADGRSIVWTRRFGVAGEYAAAPGCSRVLLIRDVMESNAGSDASTVLKGSGAQGEV